MKQLLISAALLAACGLSLAKIPTPVLDDAAKLKAAETAARSAWQSKVDGYLLCKAQDKVAAAYRQSAGKPSLNSVPAAKPAASPAAASPAATGTPVATGPAPIPPCNEPGPFAFTPPAQKPLEASGAHSPPGTAISPPSTTTPAAATPANKS